MIYNTIAKNFDILATNLSILYNYFNNQQNYFSDLYPTKILAKSMNK